MFAVLQAIWYLVHLPKIYGAAREVKIGDTSAVFGTGRGGLRFAAAEVFSRESKVYAFDANPLFIRRV